jgi:hypothetical protein
MKILNRTQRIALFLLLAGTIALMFVGKEHELWLENVSYDRDGEKLDAFDTVVASISGKGEKLEFYEEESDVIIAVGPYCTLSIEAQDGTGKNFECSKRLYLGWNDRISINVPQFVKNLEMTE